MNKEWSEKCKSVQVLIKKEATFEKGIQVLLELRGELMTQVEQIFNNYPPEAFFKCPFKGAKGYHNKTLAYSLWHIMRIEDICAHEMIANDSQVLFEGGFKDRIGVDSITTGNEIGDDDLEAFSRGFNVEVLLSYAKAVMDSTNKILLGLEFKDTKVSFDDSMKDKLLNSGSVSLDPNAVWLIDYWCGKTVAGLMGMPFSRHWIMHIEAMLRIKNRLCKIARKGADSIAYKESR